MRPKERSQSQETRYHTFLFICNVQNRQICVGKESRSAAAKGWQERDCWKERLLMGMEFACSCRELEIKMSNNSRMGG